MPAPVSQADRDVRASTTPSVSIVFLVFNRRDQLRTSLMTMLGEDVYDREHLEVIVVDNASEDGSADMVREEFPDVRLIIRDVNCGISGWNDGFAVAGGDFLLALDDDCYLPGDGLRRAVAAAHEHDADIVSFDVVALDDPDFHFRRAYDTGLFTFWGCAVLLRRRVIERLTGYDPEIFVWANELEFTLRAFDNGFRHLHLPEISAVHDKPTSKHETWRDHIGSRAYMVNARHFAYIAAKLFRPLDAAQALLALASGQVRDAHRVNRGAIRSLTYTAQGFVHGLRHRAPLRDARISSSYRRNFHTYMGPWAMSRPPFRLGVALAHRAVGRRAPREPADKATARKAAWWDARARFYPESAAILDFRGGGEPRAVAE